MTERRPEPPRGERANPTVCCTAIVEETPDAAIVSNLGTVSYHLVAAEDRPRNFYLTGAMGSTTPMGLGLAMAVDEPVAVLDGDGSLLMSLGTLTTVGDLDPENLVIVVMNNAAYETTGGQATNATETRFAAFAEDCGLRSWTVETPEELREAYQSAVTNDGAAVVDCRVESTQPEEEVTFDFANSHYHLKERFRNEFT